MLIISLIVIYLISIVICYLCYNISHSLFVSMWKLNNNLDWYKKEIYKCFIPVFNSFFILILLFRINQILKTNNKLTKLD